MYYIFTLTEEGKITEIQTRATSNKLRKELKKQSKACV